MNFCIKFGNVSIDIDHIKSPEETYWYRDQLSRPWRIDVYRFHTYGLAYITACTSVPKGIACHLMQPMQLGLEHYGAIQLAKYELDYWTLSPSGTPEEWNNFLNLPEKWRWTSLSKTKVQFNQKSNELKLSFPPYELEIEVPSIFSQLEIATHLGYEKQSPLGPSILGVAIYDLYGKSFFYNLPQYVPPSNSEKEEQVFYKQVKNLESEFNGQVIKDKDEKKIILVSTWKGNKLNQLQKNASNPDSELQKVFCYTDTHHNDEELKKWCMQFLSSIRKK